MNNWNGKLIDAYAHVGNPRYGCLASAKRCFGRLGVSQANLVLGPGMPDMQSLMQARESMGDNVRLIGIPFGETEQQRMELMQLQIRMGISGLRLMPFEIGPNVAVINRAGEEGMWLFAINPYDSMTMTRFLLDWLERYSAARVAAPHFLIPQTIDQRAEEPELFRELIRHPRFNAILSRHGGVASSKPYPHADLRPWVEEIAELMSWKRLMWGSEFPIFYQRNEQPEAVRDWLVNLGISLSEEDKADFYHANAQRLFFDRPIPAAAPVSIPSWVEEQTDRSAQVYLFPNNRMYLPMEDYDALLSDYQLTAGLEPLLDFSSYLTRKLSECARQIREDT